MSPFGARVATAVAVWLGLAVLGQGPRAAAAFSLDLSASGRPAASGDADGSAFGRPKHDG